MLRHCQTDSDLDHRQYGYKTKLLSDEMAIIDQNGYWTKWLQDKIAIG